MQRVLEPGEECDGANLNGSNCTNFGYSNPIGLKCTNCHLDPSGCKPTCGNQLKEPNEQCDDGNLAPNDGCSPTCTIETPTNNGATCMTAIPVMLGFGTQSFTGSTVNGGQHDPQSCPTDGPDRVYAVTPTASGYLTATLPRSFANFDSTLWVSTTCGGGTTQDLLCADSYDAQTNQALDGGEIISLRVQAGTTYYVYVDSFGMNGAGNYSLDLDLSAGTCADPIPIALESGVGMTFLGSTAGVQPSTQGSCGGLPGGEVVYRVAPMFSGNINVATDGMLTNFNSVLYARTSCGDAGSQAACSNQGGTAAESINYGGMMSTPMFVLVDGSTSGGGNASGNYGIVMTP
ncbi:MAG: DUF4215 domain-containing protein [Polyangiaceae bacterium]